jgi:hypothetical protein
VWCLEVTARWALAVAWLVTAILVTVYGSIDGRARKSSDPSLAISTIALTWALFLVSLTLASLRLSSLICCCCCFPRSSGYDSLGYQGLEGAAALAAGATARPSPFMALAEVLCIAWLIDAITRRSPPPPSLPRVTRQATTLIPPVAYPDYSGNTAYIGFHPNYAGRVYDIPPGGMALGVPAPVTAHVPTSLPSPPPQPSHSPAPVPPTMEVSVGPSKRAQPTQHQSKEGYEAPSAPMED